MHYNQNLHPISEDVTNTKKRLLVIFVDALGPAQLERFGARLSFLPHRRNLSGILGYSSGALPTVLTGAPPSVHGRMCLFTKKADDDVGILRPLAWLGLLPKIVHERAALRLRVGRVFAKLAGLTGYVALHRVPPEAFHWLDMPERDDLFQADRIGDARTFLADARAAGLKVYTARWQIGEQARWDEALDLLGRDPPDLAFLYSTEHDGTLHRVGNDNHEVEAVRARLASRIEKAHDLMRRGGAEVTTLLVGDHGMADIRRVIDPRDVVAKIHSARTFVDSTMMRFWGAPAAIEQARTHVERARWPGRWLSTTDLDERRAPTRGSPYGDAIFVLDEGTLFAPSFLGGAVRGMHGYDIGTRSSYSALASDRPIPEDCTELTSVAGIVRRELGLV